MADCRLHELCKARGNAEAVAALLRSDPAGVGRAGKHGRLPLHYACQSGALDTVALLIEFGSSLNAKNSFGMTPAYVAAQFGHPEVVRALCQQTGACDLGAADTGGLAPLHIAARNNRAGAVKALVELGADPEQCDSISRTARDWAKDKGAAEALQMLDVAAAKADHQ